MWFVFNYSPDTYPRIEFFEAHCGLEPSNYCSIKADCPNHDDICYKSKPNGVCVLLQDSRTESSETV